MNLIRKIKISKIADVIFTDKEKEVINYINLDLKDLTLFHRRTNPTSLCYMNANGEWVLEQTNGSLWVLSDVWYVLKNNYLMSHNEIQEFLLYMIEKELKHQVPIPEHGVNVFKSDVEDEYKKYKENESSKKNKD